MKQLVSRAGPLAAAMLATVLSACGGGARDLAGSPLTCNTGDDCPRGSVCTEGMCVQSAPPIPQITLPAQLVTNRRLQFQGSATDPEGKLVTELEWTIAAGEGGCEVEPFDPKQSTFETIFWCAGKYDVTLTATDPDGAVGIAKQTLQIEPSTGFPAVQLAAPAEVDHLCAGDPLVCDVAGGSISLLATVTGENAPFQYQWLMRAPAGIDASLAGFDPSNDVASPAARIRTPGTAISGAWNVRVLVTDGSGLVGRAAAPIVVKNRPPVVSGALAPNHTFDGTAYTVDAVLAPEVTDPDGDLVSVGVQLVESAPNGCTQGVELVPPTGAKLHLSCPNPLELIGSVGWSLAVDVMDANGASTSNVLPIEIVNRKPALSLPGGAPVPAIRTLPHHVGPCAQGTGDCFLAGEDDPLVPFDPDGDPLQPVDYQPTKTNQPDSYVRAWTSSDGASHYEVGTALAVPLQFRSYAGTSQFRVTASVADPWASSDPARFDIAFENRPPNLVLSGTGVIPHTYSAGAYRASATVGQVLDPDGDPVHFDVVGDAACLSSAVTAGTLDVSCSLAYTPVAGQAQPLATFVGDHAISLKAYDPWDTTQGSTKLTITNQAPAVSASQSFSFNGCVCVCTHYDLDGNCTSAFVQNASQRTVSAPVAFTEPENDPMQMDGQLCGAGICGLPATLTSSNPMQTFNVTLTDGMVTRPATVTMTLSACSSVGQRCYL